MRTGCVILALLLVRIINFGAVTFDVGADSLKTANGTPMPSSGLVILAASTLDSIFTAPTPTEFFSSGGDDIELARWDLTLGGGGGGLGDGIFNGTTGSKALAGNWNANDPVQLYWFPTLTLSSTVPGTGTSYGTYRDDTGLDGSEPWFTPAETQGATLLFLTDDGTFSQGSNPASSGNASFTVVPEPSHYAMACGLLCLGYAAVSRKLRRASR